MQRSAHTTRTLDLGSAVWRKSSYSEGGGEYDNSCLEVADNNGPVVPVRDCKRPRGPALLIPAPAWAAFLTDLQS
ncbi:DUF397 domain-containing protein [Streptomyces sp. NPDC021100]|uniref:DUF397 domain-containing protein n=1 Tax=Streptomyces sp. NPDC021100 TaxID=3365114 RepID=UPI0037A1A561